ncbi:MAG: glycoside hydrolase family 5 protein [Candidatus Omnitrophica bacterium]|nr:glycoside hydrolase family 5 protein [Candidatus Omnitrophota bacterium]
MFLKVNNGKVVNSSGRPVVLRGLNLGGWLMMEGYILGGRNIAERQFKKNLAQKQGQQALGDFTRFWRDTFIQEEDFKAIAAMGLNCVRLPFNYRLIEEGGLKYLKEAVKRCKKYGLWCILDLHAAPGSQNQDWHSDSLGEALLWRDKKSQDKFIKIWQLLSRAFKDEEAVAGYNIVNEPVWDKTRPILELYKRTVSAIREIDKKHIIFLEGNCWSQDIEFLGSPWDDNLVYSVHFYGPLEFTFGFVRDLKYPGNIFGEYWSKAKLKEILKKYQRLQKLWKVPIYVGEFGQNSRCPYCHREFQWTADVLDIFKEFGFHWTYWTYKCVAQATFPDGVYQYQANPAWICRQGPVYGWENFYTLWNKQKIDIVRSWQTSNFTLNKTLYSILKSHSK